MVRARTRSERPALLGFDRAALRELNPSLLGELDVVDRALARARSRGNRARDESPRATTGAMWVDVVNAWRPDRSCGCGTCSASKGGCTTSGGACGCDACAGEGRPQTVAVAAPFHGVRGQEPETRLMGSGQGGSSDWWYDDEGNKYPWWWYGEDYDWLDPDPPADDPGDDTPDDDDEDDDGTSGGDGDEDGNGGRGSGSSGSTFHDPEENFPDLIDPGPTEQQMTRIEEEWLVEVTLPDPKGDDVIDPDNSIDDPEWTGMPPKDAVVIPPLPIGVAVAIGAAVAAVVGVVGMGVWYYWPDTTPDPEPHDDSVPTEDSAKKPEKPKVTEREDAPDAEPDPADDAVPVKKWKCTITCTTSGNSGPNCRATYTRSGFGDSPTEACAGPSTSVVNSMIDDGCEHYTCTGTARPV